MTRNDEAFSRMEMGTETLNIPGTRNIFWLLRVLLKAALIVFISFLMLMTFIIFVMSHGSGNVIFGADFIFSILALLEVVAWLYGLKNFMHEFGIFIDLSM
jgi:hypothetical protein